MLHGGRIRGMTRGTDGTTPRGQSLVEFALVLPMLLVLLLGIADFGRVFAAGITLEAAARNAAEIAAEAYMDNPPGSPPRPLSVSAPLPGESDYNGAVYYPAIHDQAAAAACHEARGLPNAGYSPGPPEHCDGLFVVVCVHDGVDPYCNQAPAGFPVPSALQDCPSGSSPALDPTHSAEAARLRYVEVRVCYRFTTLFNLRDVNLPFGWALNLGAISLEKTRVFTVADW